MKYCPNEICKMNCKDFFLFGMRHAFGFWILYLGLYKWIAIGPGNFVGYITQSFAKTWSPEPLTMAMAWIIIVAEPLLGAWLLSGKCQRMAWGATAKLMFILMLGQTMLQEHSVVANNWQYLVLALVCAAMSGGECESGACEVKK